MLEDISSMLILLNHPHIVQFFQLQYYHDLCLAFEYLPEGSLDKFVENHRYALFFHESIFHFSLIFNLKRGSKVTCQFVGEDKPNFRMVMGIPQSSHKGKPWGVCICTTLNQTYCINTYCVTLFWQSREAYLEPTGMSTRVFFCQISSQLKAVHYFLKKIQRRCSTGF